MSEPSAKVTRYAMVTGIKPDKIGYYKELHAKAWPGVLKTIRGCNIRNYSIYLREIDGRFYLFGYFEYTGNDFKADMRRMGEDSVTQRWWRETDAMQLPLPEAEKTGEIWTPMEEVFHTP
ncbi:L-rhamnose mutarotase [Chitinophaga sp. Mgbs1]|uniref:L-rhamnose mutarotase n=1 Tax=Chitinophaga solisilvae TaxID=1233460 RepID=A0A433WKU3_9BACT|nr:L-rhamnose mutarotase [Chitinophaga solisilvae]